MFREILSELCTELGIECTNLSNNWVHVLSYHDKKRFIIGTRFDLNTAASATIADDKAATSATLEHENIPAVPHFLVMNTNFSHGLPFNDPEPLKNPYSSFPVVVKPLRGHSGRGVTLCKNQVEINKAALKLIKAEGANLAPKAPSATI